MLENLLKKLDSIRSKLVPQQAEPEVEEDIPKPPSPATANLMRRIKGSRAMLTVKVAGSDEIYLSALLDVNDVDGYIVIDELNSATGNRAIRATREFEISTRLEDREIKFQCQLEAIGEQNGIAYYKVPFPENLDHQLRRKHLRIDAPKGKYLPVHLHTEMHDLATGDLIDLSAGGFSAEMSRETASIVQRGDIIPKCLLHLGDQDPIETELEIRYCEDIRYHSRPRLGGKFINMDQHSERRLQKYISQIDRVNSRSHKHT